MIYRVGVRIIFNKLKVMRFGNSSDNFLDLERHRNKNDAKIRNFKKYLLKSLQ